MPAFSHPHTGNDLAGLQKLLSATLKKSGTMPVLPTGGQLRLLNLACGRADETGVLADVFGSETGTMHMTGLDIRAREISEARERWQKPPGHTSAEFLVQDAARLTDLRQLGEDFDIAFMRHQNFWNGDTTWTKIYDAALHRLSDKGLLVITSYFDREHRLALDAIQGLGAQLICSERNRHSRIVTDAPGKSVDRHVAVFRKP